MEFNEEGGIFLKRGKHVEGVALHGSLDGKNFLLIAPTDKELVLLSYALGLDFEVDLNQTCDVMVAPASNMLELMTEET